MQLTKLNVVYDELLKEDSIGAIAYHQPVEYFQGSMLHDFDTLILVIGEWGKCKGHVEHKMVGDSRCEVLHVTISCLKEWIIAGEQADIVHYLLEGDLIWELDHRVRVLRQELTEFTGTLREQKLFHEFAKFLGDYVQSKRYMREGRTIDAYQSVLKALDHWASIELVERGIYPTSHVWMQVRPLDRTVYKLYNELTLSTETLDQRIELVLLACDFSVMSKMSECSSLLFRILGSRHEPWSIYELMNHPELKYLQQDLVIVLRKLVFRSMIKEKTAGPQMVGKYEREIRYAVI